MLFWTSRKRFESLVLKEADSLYSLALRLSGNNAQAEDLVQETFLRAYRSFDRFELRSYGVRPWLFKILHNVYFSDLASKSHRSEIHDEPIWNLLADKKLDNGGEMDLAHLDWDQFDEEIKQGIESLPPKYREVLLLWSLEQLSYQQIAEICGVPIGTVMSRLYRARQKISASLKSYARSNRLLKSASKMKSHAKVKLPRKIALNLDETARVTLLK
jgi:RNA polymerase sigma-70 factor, ECF subfamily